MAISLGMIVMLIAIATGDGLREKIRSKISGFKGHVQITNYDANNSDGSVIPIDKNQNFYPKFTNIKGVKNIQIIERIALVGKKMVFLSHRSKTQVTRKFMKNVYWLQYLYFLYLIII